MVKLAYDLVSLFCFSGKLLEHHAAGLSAARTFQCKLLYFLFAIFPVMFPLYAFIAYSDLFDDTAP
jgi:hypothetical protein